MLAIRLQRVGRKKQPLYRVVVSERSKDMYGDHLEILGQYDPHKKEAALKEDRIKHWLSVGAQASASANNLLIKAGILEGDKKKSVSISKKRAAKKDAKEVEGKKDVSSDVSAETSVKAEASAKDEDAPKEEVPAEAEKTEEAPKKEAKPEESKEESTEKPAEDSKEEKETK